MATGRSVHALHWLRSGAMRNRRKIRNPLLRTAQVCTTEDFEAQMGPRAALLRTGLQDNWSQVRERTEEAQIGDLVDRRSSSSFSQANEDYVIRFGPSSSRSCCLWSE
eukprot:gene370-biopygen71